MTDGRDHRNRAISNSAYHLFLIEGPQIFQRSPTARHDQQIRTRHRAVCWHGIESAHGPRHLTCRISPLDKRAPQQDMHAEPVSQPVQNIANDGPGGAGDHADNHRHTGQHLFSVRIKQPFSRQTLAAFFKLLQHRPLAGDFHLLNDDLVF